MVIQYTVQPGDCLSSLASKFGLSSWKTIHDHPQNADLRSNRHNPNVLFPGETVFIPAGSKTKQETAVVDKRHRFQIERLPTFISLRLRNIVSGDLPPADYTFTVGSASASGPVTAETVITLKIDPQETTGRLTVTPHDPAHGFARIDMTLNLGQLDPPDTTSGVQARLTNLGFHCGPVNGQLNADTRHAIREFQLLHKMTVDGQITPALQEALRAHHGC
jgi:N-acetylmuramoyl-L-alanine amidase